MLEAFEQLSDMNCPVKGFIGSLYQVFLGFLNLYNHWPEKANKSRLVNVLVDLTVSVSLIPTEGKIE